MKQTTCVLCNEGDAQQDGEWIMFADYQALEADSVRTPPGYEFFCKAHAPYAKCFSSMPSKRAISQLKQNISLYSLDTHAPKANKWLCFFRKLYLR